MTSNHLGFSHNKTDKTKYIIPNSSFHDITKANQTSVPAYKNLFYIFKFKCNNSSSYYFQFFWAEMHQPSQWVSLMLHISIRVLGYASVLSIDPYFQ